MYNYIFIYKNSDFLQNSKHKWQNSYIDGSLDEHDRYQCLGKVCCLYRHSVGKGMPWNPDTIGSHGIIC